MASKRSRAAFESHDRGSQPSQHAPYAFYGTPLPAYDPEARDDGSYVPIWKQEVTDERGRKRLHGAFTGGFSAGYFNTVGSKEGWTPSSFVSSRAKRAGAQNDGSAPRQEQRVEDFMDEEDLAERAESQTLETQGAFAGLGGNESGGSSNAMFADLFRTTGETMGVKLLQRMGWRPGQGIGAKVLRHAEGDKKGEMHLFAPENTHMIGFSRKNDRKGLGFAGEAKLVDPEDLATSTREGGGDSDPDARILQRSRPKIPAKQKKIKKSSIGVGVLNDTGSDDEDPYAIGPQINYNRIIGGDRKKKKGLSQKTSTSSIDKPILASKKLEQRVSALSGFRRRHDGRLPLDGFILMTTTLTLLSENQYPPPQVPDGWKPSKSTESGATDTKPYQSTAEAAKASTLDPKARASLLGEQLLPGKSVFDFLSPAARERVATASGKSNLPPALGEGRPADYDLEREHENRRTLWDLIPPLSPKIAAAALQRGINGWMPYAEDETKRARYCYFLELRTGTQSLLPERPRGFSLDNWAKELREFAQAAEVFKPISGLMATRFTTSTAAPKLASDTPDYTPAPTTKEEDPAEKAARMGMFGALTRSRQPFYPSRLLCKRFGVRPPPNVSVDPGGAPRGDDAGAEGTGLRRELVSRANLDRMMREASFQPAKNSFVSGGLEGGEGGGDVSIRRAATFAEVDAEINDALERPRAGDAVFHDVFGSDNAA